MIPRKIALFLVGMFFIGGAASSQPSLEKTSHLLKNKIAQAQRHQKPPSKKPVLKKSKTKKSQSSSYPPLGSPKKSSKSMSKTKGMLRDKAQKKLGSNTLGTPPVRSQPDLMKTLEIWESLRDPGTSMPFEERVAFMEKFPEWPLKLVKKRAEESLKKGAPASILEKWFSKNPPLTGVGCFYYAQTLKSQAAQNPSRQKVFTDFVKKTWKSVDFEDAALEERFWKSFRKILQEDDHRERVSYLLYEKKHDPVTRMQKFVSGPLRTIIEVRLAFARDFKNVERLYKSLSSTLKKLPEFMHDHIRWLRLQDRAHETHPFLKTKIESGSLSQSIWPDRCEIVRDMIRDKAHGQTIYDCLCVHNIPQGGSFSDGEFLSGFVALHLLDDPKKALAHFTHLYNNVGTSISKTRAAYWAGRANEKLGHQGAAKEWYEKAARHPTIFYGQEAQKRLNKKIVIKLSSNIPVRPRSRQKFEERSIVQAIRAMKGTSYSRYLPLFLDHIAEGAQSQEDQVLILELTHKSAPNLSVPIARTMGRKGDVLLRQAYPMYPIPGHHLKKHLKKAGRSLVMSIIRKESGFDPSLESSAGARGLMQILPSTARDIYKDEHLGIPPKNIDTLLFDGKHNLKLGCLYLEDLLEEFGGSLVLTAAAYNAGRGRVRKWITQYGDPSKGEIDEVAWTEFIPYPETTNYIHRVVEASRVYQSMERGSEKNI